MLMRNTRSDLLYHNRSSTVVHRIQQLFCCLEKGKQKYKGSILFWSNLLEFVLVMKLAEFFPIEQSFRIFR